MAQNFNLWNPHETSNSSVRDLKWPWYLQYTHWVSKPIPPKSFRRRIAWYGVGGLGSVQFAWRTDPDDAAVFTDRDAEMHLDDDGDTDDRYRHMMTLMTLMTSLTICQSTICETLPPTAWVIWTICVCPSTSETPGLIGV